MTKEEIKELANKELAMYDLSEILDDAVLNFFFKYLSNDTKDIKMMTIHNTQKLNEAINSGASEIYFAAGTYYLDRPIVTYNKKVCNKKEVKQYGNGYLKRKNRNKLGLIK